MAAKNNSIQILILETRPYHSRHALEILQSPSGLKIFNVKVASTLKEAYREIQKEEPEIILMDSSPEEDPESTLFSRLHQYTPHTPILVLLDNHHQKSALQFTQLGAHGYLLDTQITENTLPTFLLRTIESHASHKAIRKSEEHFRLMIENSSDVVATLEPSGVITYAGPSTERILNYPLSEFMGKNMLDFIHRDDRRKFLDQFENAFETESPLSPVQFRFRHQRGHWIHMEGKGRIIVDPSGQKICILNSHDISHRVKLEEKLLSLSLRDELTGLHNRRSFVTCFEQQLKLVQRSKKKGIYLLFIDLDDFKQINDNLGHKVGDKALLDVAAILKTTFRQADVIARMGGDEFVVFLTDDLEEISVERLKSRLFECVGDWNNKKNRPYQLAMSVGVIYHDSSQSSSIDDLINQADELMYQQKRAKKEKSASPNASPQPEEKPGIPV